LFADELILTRRPLYAGDRIAAVAAKTKEACLLALAAIKVEYEVERPLLSIKEALAEGATPLHPEMRPDNELHKITASQGDVERGFAESDFVLEGDFATPAVQHVALEPTGCICDFSDGKNLTVWSTSQTPFQERRILSELFDLPETSVRFIKPTMGGGLVRGSNCITSMSVRFYPGRCGVR
jgi:Aerobic-type carbon monoxide dehydrogenase, large subunit CoxL/CutL homologs